MTISATVPETRRKAAVAHLRDPLYRNAYALALNSAATGGVGVLYWVLVARFFPSDDVGRDASLISAITALSGIAQLNFATTLPRLMPPSPRPTRWLVRAYVLNTLCSLLLGIAFVVVAPMVSPSWQYLRDEPLVAVGFVVSLAGLGIYAIKDAGLAALGHAPLVPAGNLAFGIAKLGLAALLGVTIAMKHSVLVSWFVPMFLLLIPMNIHLFRASRRATERARQRPPSPLAATPRLMRMLTLDYLAGIAFLACWGGVPLLVVTQLGETPAAHFNVAFAIGTALAAASVAMGTSLTVETSRDPARLAELARQSLRRIVILLVPIGLAIAIGAELVMRPFGSDYVSGGSHALRLMALAAIPSAFTNMAHAVARVRGNAGLILGHRILSSTLMLSGAWLATRTGSLTRVALVWMLTELLCASIAGLWFTRTLRLDAEANAARATAAATDTAVAAKGDAVRAPVPLRAVSVAATAEVPAAAAPVAVGVSRPAPAPLEPAPADLPLAPRPPLRPAPVPPAWGAPPPNDAHRPRAGIDATPSAKTKAKRRGTTPGPGPETRDGRRPRRRWIAERPRILNRGHIRRPYRIAHGVFYLLGLTASAWAALDWADSGVHTALVLVTMLLLPGGLVIGRTGIDDLVSEVAFGVGLSLASWVIGAQIMLAVDAWDPESLLIIITTLSAVVWLAEPSSER